MTDGVVAATRCAAAPLAMPRTFAGLLVGQRVGRRFLFRGTVEWDFGLRTAQAIVRDGRPRTASPFHNFTVFRAVTWLDPTVHVEVTYSEMMAGRLRDPVYRGLA